MHIYTLNILIHGYNPGTSDNFEYIICLEYDISDNSIYENCRRDFSRY